MNLTQYLLVKVAEEASEVSKEALKASQFGLGSTYKCQHNARHLLSELLDLAGVVTMLEQHAKTGQYLDNEPLWPFAPTNNLTGYHLMSKWYKVCYNALASVRAGLLTLTQAESEWVHRYAKLHEPGLQV